MTHYVLRAERSSRLTQVELAILALTAQGLTDSAIGQELTYATDTVKTHQRRLRRRLGARDRAHAVGLAFAPFGFTEAPDADSIGAGSAPLLVPRLLLLDSWDVLGVDAVVG